MNAKRKKLEIREERQEQWKPTSTLHFFLVDFPSEHSERFLTFLYMLC